MKTIEERAKAFCEKNICVDCGDRKDCDRKCLGTCIPTYDTLEWLIQFGKSEHTESTRWNDPKDIMPEPGKKVLVKCISGEIQTDFYEPELDGFFIEHATYAKVIGWMEIYE